MIFGCVTFAWSESLKQTLFDQQQLLQLFCVGNSISNHFARHLLSFQCIELNPSWPKAHVRLASAYIALGGHSNDACLSLQRALSLDRNNAVAREMLVKEMRQRNARERTGETSSSSSSHQEENGRDDAAPGMHPTNETPSQHHSNPNASAPPQHNDASHTNNTAPFEDVDDIDPQDTTLFTSISQRIQHYLANFTTWYHSQSEDIQTLLKVLCVFLVLYVLLGGRFGLDYALGGKGSSNRRGNYGEGNAYDRYSSPGSSSRRTQYSSNNHGSTTSGGSSGYNDRTSSQNSKYYSRYESDHYYEPRGRRQSTSWHMVSLCGRDLVKVAAMILG